MSVKKRVRTRLPKEERREQILAAAVRAFVRGGFHGTHVDQIIEEAGVARGTFYLYFESKHAVFAALVERMLGVFLAAQVPYAPGVWDDRRSLTAALRTDYLMLIRAVRKQRDLCRLFLEEAAGLDRDFADQVERHRAAWHARVQARIEEARAAGLARKTLDSEVTAWAIVGMGEMILRRYVLGRDEPDEARLASALAAFDLDGILGKA